MHECACEGPEYVAFFYTFAPAFSTVVEVAVGVIGGDVDPVGFTNGAHSGFVCMQ
jgi:hypothetical protein